MRKFQNLKDWARSILSLSVREQKDERLGHLFIFERLSDGKLVGAASTLSDAETFLSGYKAALDINNLL